MMHCHKRPRRGYSQAPIVIVVGVLTCCAACPAPEPYYDAQLNMEAVPVEEGAMAGLFALKIQSTTETEIPLLGKVVGGGDTYALVNRVFNPEDQTYSQETALCGGLIRSENSESTIDDDDWQKVPSMAPRALELNDGEGYLAVDGYIELWGLHNLSDPWTDPLPADEVEAEEPPFRDQIVDMDEDGNPGMTIHVDGLVSGDFYFVQRKTADLEGILLGPDRTLGLQVTQFEQTILGSDSGPTQQGYPQNPHPDPMQSWFEEVRLSEDATCDDVMDAVTDGRLSRLRPF